MKTIHLTGAFMLLATLGASTAIPADVRLIANPAVTVSGISAEDLRGVFLLTKTTLADGNRVEPVLEKNGTAHEAFVKEYLGKSDAALQTYYRSLVFTGKGSIPKTLGTDEEVVAYVAKTKGAIGYVGSTVNTAGVKILEVK